MNLYHGKNNQTNQEQYTTEDNTVASAVHNAQCIININIPYCSWKTDVEVFVANLTRFSVKYFQSSVSFLSIIICVIEMQKTLQTF